MPMNSVNTNVGAMVALQNLNHTNTDLATTQNRINTGLKVGSAKDNGAIWAIAQNQRATSQSLDAVKESLQRGSSTVDVAMAAGETVSDLLIQMKQKALAASDTTLDTNSRIALNDDFKSLRDQIAKAVTNADFNGSNMIKALGGHRLGPGQRRLAPSSSPWRPRTCRSASAIMTDAVGRRHHHQRPPPSAPWPVRRP